MNKTLVLEFLSFIYFFISSFFFTFFFIYLFLAVLDVACGLFSSFGVWGLLSS